MIKRIIFILVLCICMGKSSVYGCDICGCGAGNMGIGLLSTYKNNTFRLSYFNAEFSSLPGDDKFVSDRFTQTELYFSYTLGNTHRVRLQGQLPYGMNSRDSYDEDQTQSMSGIGDARIIANYILFNITPVGKWGTFYTEVGGGLSIPIGKFDPDIHDKNLPENFNIGKGALGYLTQTNSVLSINQTGIVLNNIYSYNRKSTSGYRYGSQWNTNLSVYREIPVGNVKLIPSAGLGYEYVSIDTYENGNDVNGTGGKGVFLPLSFNIKTNNWLVGMSYSQALTENYSEGEVNAKGRVAFQFSYFF